MYVVFFNHLDQIFTKRPFEKVHPCCYYQLTFASLTTVTMILFHHNMLKVYLLNVIEETGMQLNLPIYSQNIIVLAPKSWHKLDNFHDGIGYHSHQQSTCKASGSFHIFCNNASYIIMIPLPRVVGYGYRRGLILSFSVHHVVIWWHNRSLITNVKVFN